MRNFTFLGYDENDTLLETMYLDQEDHLTSDTKVAMYSKLLEANENIVSMSVYQEYHKDDHEVR